MRYSNLKWLFRLMAAAPAFAFFACEDDNYLLENDTRPTEYLSFTTSLKSTEAAGTSRGAAGHFAVEEEDWDIVLGNGGKGSSRASAITELNGLDAGVIGFSYDSPDDRTPLSPADNNVPFHFEYDELTSKGAPIRWNSIKKDNLDIYAYAPMEIEGATIDPLSVPSMSYNVPEDISKQADILFSKWSNPEGTDYKGQTIPLNFSHIMSAIRLRVNFACTIKSVEISGVCDSGVFDFAAGQWNLDDAGISSYKLDFGEEGKAFGARDMIMGSSNGMILIPQTLPKGAMITLITTEQTYTASIEDLNWRPGKVITYTLYRRRPPEVVYFDLAAGNVTINAKSYSGFRFENGEKVSVSGEHNDDDESYYYVYQTTEKNRNEAGLINGEFVRPAYGTVLSPDGTQEWREYIVNNTDVDAVIDAWCKGSDKVAADAGREGTEHRIQITGQLICNVTIDNIYSTYQDNKSRDRTTAGISFVPSGSGSVTTINMIGENRLGAIHYHNSDSRNQINLEGSGSLTVCDVDGLKATKPYNEGQQYFGLEEGQSGYFSNWWAAAIGGADSKDKENSVGIFINSGRIFAGTTKAENCSAIGGGGNGTGTVTITGGLVTAVATTTGTAIGGGIGFMQPGGIGNVTISGGNVYAYNHANRWNIPSSAIGGAGSRDAEGNAGNVTITDGSVYAQSALGTAIGGGSSYTNNGGAANVVISGGEIIAKTLSGISTSIGGGTGYTQTGASSGSGRNGGRATVTIQGNPIIRTGSIGGGGTGDSKGYLGYATIKIYSGDIQGQFILAAGSAGKPSFEMSGGTIRNSNTSDTEYLHVNKDGGAVYLEDGTVTITGGTITKCSADNGGAIYIKGTSTSLFKMTGGNIYKNSSSKDGGGIYMESGTVRLEGGQISENLTVAGNGAGIYINGGNLEIPSKSTVMMTMNAAQEELIDNSLVGGYGGAVYISSATTSVEADIQGGTILGNTADNKGGGLCVDMNTSDLLADVIIGKEGGSEDSPLITKNFALMQGGGLYARGTNARITINSGSIIENEVSQYVTNDDVANEFGSVTLIGGNVTHNVITFHSNPGNSEDEELSTQNIVTSTNSTLRAPAFTRTGYRLVGWNSQRDGDGDDNYLDGQVMNISRNIHIYAQWAPVLIQ
ncbi:MAG: fimbrillin family protein [Clostridium sp.]|nr:fimbrillin family protein [Clostridium sp.]